MPVPSLPNEILGVITSKVPRQDHHTFISLALASRRFLSFARAQLYHDLEVQAEGLNADDEFNTGWWDLAGQRRVGRDDEEDEDWEDEESQEEWATRYFLHHFSLPSRKLLETFMANPQLGIHVRSISLGMWNLDDAGDGERVLETMVAPSSGLRRLEVKSVGWGTEAGEQFQALLTQLAPNLTKLTIPGAAWSKRRLAGALQGFPKLDTLRITRFVEDVGHDFCRSSEPKFNTPPFQLSTLLCEGYVGEEEFRTVVASSASSLKHLRLPMLGSTHNLSVFTNLTMLTIETCGSGHSHFDLDTAQGIVAAVQTRPSLQELAVTTMTMGVDLPSLTPESWEGSHFLSSLPSTLTTLNIFDITIRRPYLLTFLRDASLAPKLSKLMFMEGKQWGDDPTLATIVEEEDEIKKLCAERGIELLERWCGAWYEWEGAAGEDTDYLFECFE